MSHKHTSSESGQVMVLLALVILGLVAFAALVFDGGMILADHRSAQNAGDAAVLAGAYRIANSLDDYQLGYSISYENWDCADVAPVMTLGQTEAQQQAGANNYPMDASALIVNCSDGSGADDYGSYEDRYVDVQATITSQAETSFLHLFSGSPLIQTITAGTRVRPRMSLAFGYAIYAHRKDCPNSNVGGVHFNTNKRLTVNGGGIMSDACMRTTGSKAKVTVNGGEINYVTEYQIAGNPSVVPSPTDQDIVLPNWALLFTKPDCSDLPTAASDGDGTINPGIYDGIQVTGQEELIMTPGLYCFTDDFRMDGASVVGGGVTIYMLDGGVTTNGNAVVTLSAPNYVASSNDGVTGMLIYLDADNGSEVKITGNADSSYSGTVYGVSEESAITFSGTSTCELNSQLIAGTVTFNGTSNVTVNFDPEVFYSLPSRLTLEK